MATLLKRLLMLALPLALLLGVTPPLIPAALSPPQVSVSTDTASGCDGPQLPCNMPSCLDHSCCITVSALPASPACMTVPIEWTSLAYILVRRALAGISIKPELSPPILRA